MLEKREYLLKTLELFKENCEVDTKTIKHKISSSAYYSLLLPKILDINNYFEINSSDYFIIPKFLRNNSTIMVGLKINPNICVEIKDKFVVIKMRGS